MLGLGVFLFSVSFWAVVFWGSLALIDRGNSRNKFALALLIGVLAVVTAFTRSMMPFADIVYLVVWLVLLLRLLALYYHVDLLRSIGVVAATLAAPYLILPLFVRAVGGSEAKAWLVLYGFPVVTIGAWIALRTTRGRDAGERIPRARVARVGKDAKRDDAPAAPPPVIAAPAVPPPRPDGEPTLLS
ncbi:MAG TPA: hypothetical protein VLX92_31255 [Kofleriaceae bacterium]|nr:hypothetical protein [Kofleriaceae bacterium]